MGSVKNALLPIFQHSDIIFPPDFQLKTFCVVYLQNIVKVQIKVESKKFL